MTKNLLRRTEEYELNLFRYTHKHIRTSDSTILFSPSIVRVHMQSNRMEWVAPLAHSVRCTHVRYSIHFCVVIFSIRIVLFEILPFSYAWIGRCERSQFLMLPHRKDFPQKIEWRSRARAGVCVCVRVVPFILSIRAYSSCIVII